MRNEEDVPPILGHFGYNDDDDDDDDDDDNDALVLELFDYNYFTHAKLKTKQHDLPVQCL